MKKVLIVTYYWPPAGGSGVQRWLYFTKYLREFGIEPIIYAPRNPSYPVIDESLNEEIPEKLNIIKRPIREPNQLTGLFLKKQTKNLSSGIIEAPKNQSWLQKSMLYIRGNFFIPDARVLWVKPSVKYLHKFLGQEEIKTVITTGPPHSMHLIGLGLKKRLNIKWIADFRDPWTEIHYHNKLPLTKKSKRKHKELEKKVLENSDSILTTSLTTKNNFKVKTSTPVDFLPNGFTDFQKKNFALDKKFTLSYIGRLYDGNYLLVILQALSELTEENKDFKSHFQFNYVGDNESIIQRLFKKFHLGKFLNCTGQVSHSQSIDHQRSSQVLLLLLSEDFTSEIIPGKLFEYLNAKRPIIAIGPKNWDVKEILDETQGGSCFNYKDKEGLKKQIKTHFEAYQNQDLHAHSKNLEQYHRRELTGKLAGLI